MSQWTVQVQTFFTKRLCVTLCSDPSKPCMTFIFTCNCYLFLIFRNDALQVLLIMHNRLRDIRPTVSDKAGELARKPLLVFHRHRRDRVKLLVFSRQLSP
jgi:hypothetical protein